MGCAVTLSNILLGCLESMGGIKEIYLASYSDVKATASQGVIDEAGLVLTTGKKFYVVEIQKQTGSMTSTRTIDATAGVNYVTTDLALQIKKMSKENRIPVEEICRGDMVAVVLDSNNQAWYLGYDNPVTASANTGETGTNYGDSNQYTITLQDMSKSLPYPLTDEAFEKVKDSVERQ